MYTIRKFHHHRHHDRYRPGVGTAPPGKIFHNKISGGAKVKIYPLLDLWAKT
jgi:hypothetical protein